jgi:hypothetical protein
MNGKPAKWSRDIFTHMGCGALLLAFAGCCSYAGYKSCQTKPEPVWDLVREERVDNIERIMMNYTTEYVVFVNKDNVLSPRKVSASEVINIIKDVPEKQPDWLKISVFNNTNYDSWYGGARNRTIIEIHISNISHIDGGHIQHTTGGKNPIVTTTPVKVIK